MKSVIDRNYFAGQKITLMGLGLLGRGVGDAQFLAEAGASLIVTDLKTKDELALSLKKLQPIKNYENIKFILGQHRLDDFHHRDLIIQTSNTPLNSPYLAEARRTGVAVITSVALFAKMAMERGVKIIGVTGTRGKSTTTQLIYEILKKSGRRVWLGGNVKGISTLALLKKVKSGDWAVLELDSWQLQGFGEAKISPHIAIFTNFMTDHLNYYGSTTLTTNEAMARYWADKENIFKWQQPGDYAIRGWELTTVVPKNWKIKLLGKHNHKNIACAIRVAEILGLDKKLVKKVVENFVGLPGRLEWLRVVRGVKIYNDTTSTTPDALLAALKALGQQKKVILIAGGADKNLPLGDLVGPLSRYCQELILLPGAGTEKLKPLIQNLKIKIIDATDLRRAVSAAILSARRGDTILFSPGFASFGLFKNEFDRGEKFAGLVKKLK